MKPGEAGVVEDGGISGGGDSGYGVDIGGLFGDGEVFRDDELEGSLIGALEQIRDKVSLR